MKLPKVVFVYICESYGPAFLQVVTDCDTLEDGTVVGIYELKEKARVRTEVSLENV